MKKPLQFLAMAAAVTFIASIADREAHAQIRLGVGVPGADVNVGARTETNTSGPYVYDACQPGHGRTRGDVHRRHYRDARYEGYDGYEAFQYTYENGDRARYETTFCYNQRDRPYEVRETGTVSGFSDPTPRPELPRAMRRGVLHGSSRQASP
ncbi:MAG: hypothetical protein WEA77_09665 [Hyphomonas sp.]|uniref:hypothetical protein n=1 Tax=Hyphomonas sp. TaxID=87 RepID=UPI0034A042D3